MTKRKSDAKGKRAVTARGKAKTKARSKSRPATMAATGRSSGARVGVAPSVQASVSFGLLLGGSNRSSASRPAVASGEIEAELAIQRAMMFDGCDREEAERRYGKAHQRGETVSVGGKRLRFGP